MISLDILRNYYPPYLRENAGAQKYILKEYILLMILDFLSSSTYVKNIAFIGGTSLRLTKGIDRFSEDLDFDCKNFSESDFIDMSNDVVIFLQRSGYNAEIKENQKQLKAFRRNIIFPQLLFNLDLSGHKDEKFLLKLECQDQLFGYKTELVNIKGCGFYFPFPVPPASVVCSMKIAAMLDRQKGRDFYDVIFLLSQTLPEFNYLGQKLGIANLEQLKIRVREVIEKVELKNKVRDFEHLLFHKSNAQKILRIKDFFEELSE